MVKLDGAFISVEKDDSYPKKLVKSVLKADKEIQKKKSKEKLKVYNSVDDMFAEL